LFYIRLVGPGKSCNDYGCVYSPSYGRSKKKKNEKRKYAMK
jgi:hypothetical protein